MSEKKILLDALNRLIPSQFEEVIFHYNIPSRSIVPGSQTERAISIIKFAETRYPNKDDFAQLREAIEEVTGKGFLPNVEPTADYFISTNVSRSENNPKQKTKVMSTPLKLFYSYSHADEELRDKLAKHLKILQRQGIIEEWHDRAIEAGNEWEAEIFKAMEEARIILLLISSDFIASDYCWGKELKESLAKHERGEARVIPIILRPVDWAGAPFSKLQALPKNARPITLWENIDEAMQGIAQGIRRAAESFNNPH